MPIFERSARAPGYLSALAMVFLGSTLLWLSPVTLAQESAHSPGWVVISVPDYHALRVKAFPAEREPEPPPVDATLTRVDYDLRVDSDFASGTATLTVDVLKNGWVRVPIPSGLFVREAKLDGKPLSLTSLSASKDASQLSALLFHTGRAVITLTVALPIAATAGQERVSLPATFSGVTRVTMEIPRTGVDLSLYGGLFSEASAGKNPASGAKWTAYGKGGEPIVFSWRRKIEEHHNALPLRMHGALTQFVGLGEDATSISANVTLDVTQGATKEARLQLPENITINQVQGATVGDWEMKPGELLITFLEPVEQSASFVITGEANLPRDGQLDIPLLRLQNVERETGGVGVDVLGAGEIKEDTVKAQGLKRADASDLGEPVSSRQSPALLAFRTHANDAKSQRSLRLALYATVYAASSKSLCLRALRFGARRSLVSPFVPVPAPTPVCCSHFPKRARAKKHRNLPSRSSTLLPARRGPTKAASNLLSRRWTFRSRALACKFFIRRSSVYPQRPVRSTRRTTPIRFPRCCLRKARSRRWTVWCPPVVQEWNSDPQSSWPVQVQKGMKALASCRNPPRPNRLRKRWWTNSTPAKKVLALPEFFQSVSTFPLSALLCSWSRNSPVKISPRPLNSTISRTKRQVASETYALALNYLHPRAALLRAANARSAAATPRQRHALPR